MTIIQLTPEQLDERLRAVVRTELSQVRSSDADPLLTRLDAAKLLGITLVTLHNWVRTGKIKARRIGSRVYFKESELFKEQA